MRSRFSSCFQRWPEVTRRWSRRPGGCGCPVLSDPKNRTRGEALCTEQKLIERASHCYGLSEVRRVLEAEATARGWLVDHLETRWSMYREARGFLRAGWSAASEAWTGQNTRRWPGAKAAALRIGAEFDPPVEWRQTETDIGSKIRHAEDKLFEKHGLAGAYELVAMSGCLMEKQTARGGRPTSSLLRAVEMVRSANHRSRRFGQAAYSGTSLVLFEESRHYFCRASTQRRLG